MAFHLATWFFASYVAPMWPRDFMTRKNLSDRTLKALKPAPPGSRYDKRDAQVPGLIVRVTEKGTRTFMLQARFAGAPGPPGERWAPIQR